MHFHLNGQDCDVWQALIGRARSKNLTRAVKLDQAAVDRVASVPTQCSNCGAAFAKPILRGQTEIKCEFCGTAARF